MIANTGSGKLEFFGGGNGAGNGFCTPISGLLNGPGGGPIGAVLLSPFVTPGTVSTQPYNHYSMLRSIEDIFHLPHLGYSAELPLQQRYRDVMAYLIADGTAEIQKRVIAAELRRSSAAMR